MPGVVSFARHGAAVSLLASARTAVERFFPFRELTSVELVVGVREGR